MSLLEQFRASSQLGTGNAAYMDELYELWLADANSVGAEWQRYFDSLKGREAGDRAHGPVIAGFVEAAKQRPNIAAAAPVSNEYAEKQAAVLKLVTAYRSRGHLGAALDPLGLTSKPEAPDLDLPFHGLSNADLDTEFTTNSLVGASRMTLRDLLNKLKATYSSSIGAEFMHISDSLQRRWFYDRLERTAGQFGFDVSKRQRLLERLTAAEGLERYLHTKYVGQKRFSLEGGESLIPMVDGVIQTAGTDGVKEIVIGMAHRGRLNLLINTLGKAPGLLFDEFEGKHAHHTDPAHTGDVKYHMGYSADVRTPGGAVHLALAFNPSHLEIVDPVVAGSVRARQARRNDDSGSKVLPILVHGDSAFAGQGVIMELFNMSQARGFAVGGTVHLVVNNQVGFTTSRPDDTRSTLYCTDVAKMVGAPIIHVNGDDPEACLFVAELAFAYRQQFARDIVIDLVCYRRHGHNEADEPAATQPLMYQNIRARKTTRELYAEQLARAAVINSDDAKAMVDGYRAKLDAGQSVAELSKPDDGLPHIEWHHFHDGKLDDDVVTGMAADKLKTLSDRINIIPANWSLHSRVAKVYDDRIRMANGELRMDWGFAETLAYATLIDDGYKLRVDGQDAGRGTFFHRHAIIHDQKTGEAHFPLRALAENPKSVAVIDSVLSEEAVMGFEYGYSTADPQTLVIWEGQFGDFVNGAQVIIDQFISSGESKWGRLCGLALFLPHGYEGQGPEHSSARLERFLQLCAENNMQVVVPSTPAQMFHMIRRQMLRSLRKPLIVMTPKSLLRHELSVSSLKDLTDGGFATVLDEVDDIPAGQVHRVVFCSGKVYFDLLEARRAKSQTDVALVRIEQLYPFPGAEYAAVLARYPQAREVVWCQEEPQNQGAWYQIRHQLQRPLQKGQELYYAGRPGAAAPAPGIFQLHVQQQQALVETALSADVG